MDDKDREGDGERLSIRLSIGEKKKNVTDTSTAMLLEMQSCNI